MFGLAAVQQTTGELFSPGALERGLNSRLTTSTETSPITGSGISETAPTARTTRTNPHSTVERHSARRSRSGWLRYASMERKNTSATSTQKQKHAEPTLRASLRRLKPHCGALRPRRPQTCRGRLPEPHSGLLPKSSNLRGPNSPHHRLPAIKPGAIMRRLDRGFVTPTNQPILSWCILALAGDDKLHWFTVNRLVYCSTRLSRQRRR